jgi:hypothetical protein
MALSDQQRVDIRRFCGYPVFGTAIMPVAGYRFFQDYGQLEYRMTNMSDNEVNTLVTVYLAPLYKLESDVPGSADNLDTSQAGPWIHNDSEVQDRLNLFNYLRRYLCTFMGVRPGPQMDPRK